LQHVSIFCGVLVYPVEWVWNKATYSWRGAKEILEISVADLAAISTNTNFTKMLWRKEKLVTGYNFSYTKSYEKL